MLKLPKIPYPMDKDKQQVVSMGNINYSKMTQDGDIADSSGISGRHYPYITTAKGNADEQKSPENYGALAAMTYFRGKRVEIFDNGRVWYGEEEVGALPLSGMNYSDIQFAAINTKLVMMPFKKYLDVGGEEVRVRDLGAQIKATADFKTNSITLTSEMVQSYKMFCDNSSERRFTALKKDTGLTFDDTTGLVFDDENKTFTFTKFINTATLSESDAKILKTYATGAQIFAMKGYGLYLHAKDSDRCKRYSVKEIYSGETYIEDWYNVTIHLTEEVNIAKRNLGIYVFSYVPYYFSVDEDATVRFRLKAGSSQYDFYATAKADMGRNGLTICKFQAEEIPYIGKYFLVGTIDNGGWEGDFRDFISGEEEVTIIKREITDEGVGEKTWSCTASDITENSFRISSITDNEGEPLPTDEEIGGELLELSVKGSNIANDLFFSKDVVTVTVGETEITFLIDSISEDGVVIYAASDIFGEGEGKLVTIERRIPKLDYICECDNRLYGCSNDDNTIYVSALGDPTNIYAYQGISTDSYAVAVASEGDFTGCYPYDGGVLFWKENKLHKLLGSYPAEYALYTYNIDGVQEGSHKSLQNIGEVLYYKGVRGVFAFDGSPRLISENFGEKRFLGAVAGNDGEHYFVSMEDEGGSCHFFSYNTRTGLWVREGDNYVTAFARKGNDAYMLEGGEIKLYGATDTPADAEWFVRFTPFYETIDGKKSYSRIKLRVELPRESYMIVSVRCDGGRWAECGKVIGRREGIVPVMVPVNRCDKFELKIEGKGPCTIHSILREYYVGGDR